MMSVLKLPLAYLRLVYKLFFFVTIIGGFLVVASIWRMTIRDLKRRRWMYSRTVTWTCRLGNFILGIKVNGINVPPKNSSFLLVSNHSGYCDILAMSSIRPSLFITSIEMRNTPFLGLLTEMGGCLYVERRSRSNIGGEIDEIKSALLDGASVVLYPEGTSTNASALLPFKKSLFLSAIGTERKILPVVVNYRRVSGVAVNTANRDNVFWYGDMSFFTSLIRLFQQSSLEIDVEFLDPLEIHTDDERKVVVERAYQQILAKFHAISGP